MWSHDVDFVVFGESNKWTKKRSRLFIRVFETQELEKFGKFSWLVLFNFMVNVSLYVCVWLNYWDNQSREFINFFPSHENQSERIHIVQNSILLLKEFGWMNRIAKKKTCLDHMFVVNCEMPCSEIVYGFFFFWLMLLIFLVIRIFLFK